MNTVKKTPATRGRKKKSENVEKVERVVKKRNRGKTTERILQSMGELISQHGIAKSGVNALAKHAGVNKVLIYRYFGGWDGLFEEYVKQNFFLTTHNEKFSEMNESDTSLSQTKWTEYMLQFMRQLNNTKSSHELLRWEMANPDADLTKRLVKMRNESFEKLLKNTPITDSFDPATSLGIILAGLTYLIITSSQHNMMGIELETEEGWNRLEQGVRNLCEGLGFVVAQQAEPKEV